MNQPLTIGGITFDRRLTLLIILSVILPMIDFYDHHITGTKAYDRLVLYFVIPCLIIWLGFGARMANYGFKLGQWRVGLKYTLVACLFMGVVLWFAARTPAMQSYYQRHATKETLYLLYINGVDLFGWEFMWRGMMLFGMARVLGPGPAIFLQAVPFAFMHLGKPELETFSTIFGGAAFGYMAWKSESFLYPFFIHWFISSFTMLVATGRIG